MRKSKTNTGSQHRLSLFLFLLNLAVIALALTSMQAGPKAAIPISGWVGTVEPEQSTGMPLPATNTPPPTGTPRPTSTLPHTTNPALTPSPTRPSAPASPTISPTISMPSSTPTRSLPTQALWTGRERVTILVMGLDLREEPTVRDVPRTDSMILLTIDPVAKTAGMLSIPRDLWVFMPEMDDSYKINTAYRWGEIYKLPGGGPGMAMRTVSQVMGVPIQYYVLLDFNAFVRFIDEMGGLDMHIREEIIVDPVGPGNTTTLEPGVQTLSGDLALAYARTRHTEFDDFDRSTRQQEVILAIRKQILDFHMLPVLVDKAPVLYKQIVSGIRTNLTLDQVIRLAWLAAQVPEKNIRRSVFDLHKDFKYETVETSEGPQDVLILIPERVPLLRQEIFPEH